MKAALAVFVVLVIATADPPLGWAQTGRSPAVPAIPRAPVVIVETVRGTFAFELFHVDAPVSVAHVTTLVTKGFYDGQRVHRALPGFVVQFGDPQTRDDSKRALWGRGREAASGQPVGVAEIGTKRLHRTGAVGLAHVGDPAEADSQIYITLAPRPDLDTRYVIVGQVIEGADVPAQTPGRRRDHTSLSAPLMPMTRSAGASSG